MIIATTDQIPGKTITANASEMLAYGTAVKLK